MLLDEPTGFPGDVAPHSGGLNVAYGDGHAKYYRCATTPGSKTIADHNGDGLYPGQ
jgi:prepilin-type processing-associated H-X9-DG protein